MNTVGYRVKFTNYNHEAFFSTWVDAKNYLLKYETYGYTGGIETIYFQTVSN